MQERYEVRDPKQIRAMIHPLRKQILRQLARGASTPSEVARAVGVAASKVHYHVRILETAGLVTLVDTKQIGSVKELYFEPIAREILIRPEVHDDESLDLVYDDARSDMIKFVQDMRRAKLSERQSTQNVPSLFSHLIVTADDDGKKRMDEAVALLFQQFRRAKQNDLGNEYRLVMGFVRTDES